MPLPRFDRLAPSARAAILTVARAHFARDGKDAASFNQIIADAGISKTSAYHYFDGKDDLFTAVAADAADRALAVLGPWTEVDSAQALWEQIATGANRLAAHLRDHPDDRAILAAARPDGHHPWIDQLLDNGLRLGLIDPHPDIELITLATAAVIATVDAWTLDRSDELHDSLAPTLTLLLSRLWNTPNDLRMH
ncbi:TetR family transcriptional regulator [Krasilnikovia cinnamomea]|uniref:TetR family transcriptional regulator n=1 Tax=Krasilnikovia cinnamomea TaxID=349313 RepID=A0A4Q7ZG57_9ACTN|nr:TetR/AcrR family transcriptional regulator [Krasilnikovia cinnamomea]RZU49354.1 TetR family transcriptional regulator [Krasilnikovia cinnamomea]